MSIEARELSDLRRDLLAAESFLAAEHEPPKERPEREDEPINGMCLCCGKRRHIPFAMHVCIPCFEENEP